jgi:hypothetical protein
MFAGGGLAPLADVPDGECRDGPPEHVIRRKHPAVAVPVLPRWRDEIGQTIGELKRRKFDDAVGPRTRGLPPASYWDDRALPYFGELPDRGRGLAGDAWQYGASGLVPWQAVDKTGQALSSQAVGVPATLGGFGGACSQAERDGRRHARVQRWRPHCDRWCGRGRG